MKLWNSLLLFLKLTLLNHLKNCIKNNSIWEVECKIGKVSLQDGQKLKETGIISGFIKDKMWVQCRLLFLRFSLTNLKGDDFPEYDTLLYQKYILFQTVQNKKRKKINLKTKCYTFHTIIRLQKEPFDTKDFNWGKTVWKTRLS